MERLVQEVRFALRVLVRSPGSTTVAVLTLAIGIGANTAVFSLVHAALLKPLSYPNPDRLVRVYDVQPQGPRFPAMFESYTDWQTRARGLEALGAYTWRTLTLTGDGDPVQLRGTAVTASLLPLLGMRPALGRWFTEEEDQPGGPRVVMLGHGLWEQRLGADPDAIGGTITLDGEPWTVVGVMPAGFAYPPGALFVPLQARFDPTRSRGHYLFTIGRLAPGVSLAAARQELDALGARLEAEGLHNHGIFSESLRAALVGDADRPLLILLGAVAFVLLIACANVANVMLSRALARRRELAIRTAIGARVAQIVRQLLVESVLVALAGGALGLLAGSWMMRLLVTLTTLPLPATARVEIDTTVLVFTFGVAVLTGLLFGVVPGWQALHADPLSALHDGGRGTAGAGARRLGRALVAGEVAVALVLVAGASLMAKSLWRLESQDLGYAPSGILTFQVALAPRHNGAARVAFVDALVERLRGAPGVESVGAISALPLAQQYVNGPIWIEGRGDWPRGEEPLVEFATVVPGYFETMRIPVVEGRRLSDADGPDSTVVAVVNEAFARRFWGDERPIGRHVYLSPDRKPPIEVVGVVADAKVQSLDREAPPGLFLTYRQSGRPALTFVLRTSGNPSGLAPVVRAAVSALDPDQPVGLVRTMDEWVARDADDMRGTSVLAGSFAVLAIVLAALGVYGVIACSVAQRTREIGIRVAIGAAPRAVFRAVVGEGLRLAGLGIAAGLVGALALDPVLRSQLYQVSPSDPWILAGTAALLGLAAVTACLVPARRALGVDPIVTLRAE